MESKTPTALATEKQTGYIRELIRAKRMDAWRKADAIRATTTPEQLARREFRTDADALTSASLLVRVYEAIVVPSDLNQKQASAWIDALQRSTLIDSALDKPAVAERLGLAALIAEVGPDAIWNALGVPKSQR